MATNLKHQVAQSLTRYNMLSPGDKLGVAVSGGADSVALLYILCGLGQYSIVVLHVNHQLRASESDTDEQFVRDLAASLALPLKVKQAPIGAGNMEQQARDARRTFFAEARERLALRCVALGHNQSDQAETVLYRFLRGSGLAGLAGMRPVTEDGLIRPMLEVTREEIRTWASEQGIAWREDTSNQNTDLVRNRLRFQVFNPQLVQVLSANAVVARDEEDWWQRRIAELFQKMAITSRLGVEFSVSALAKLHPAEQRRLLRHAVRQVKGDLRSIDLSHIDGIRKLLHSETGHDRIQLPGIDGLRSFGILLLAEPGRIGNEPRHYQMFTEIGKLVALPHDGGRLYVDWKKPVDQFCGNFGVEAGLIQEGLPKDVTDLDGESLTGLGPLDGMYVRNWEPGDEYRRAGHEKSEKIKTLFQEDRILLWERRHWPVLILDGEIVWSRRFGAAAKFQAHEASRSILRLIYVA